MLHNEGLVQRLAELPSMIGVRQGTWRRSAATAACILALTAPSTYAEESSSAVSTASTAGATQSVAPTAGPSVPREATTMEPNPSATSQPTAPAQAPVTVTQPPGISGYLPVDYLLGFFAATLMTFLATRPGTKGAVKALGKLFTGSGQGSPPV